MYTHQTMFKVLDADGVAYLSRYTWPLPHQDEDGSWTPGVAVPTLSPDQLRMCCYGYHLCLGPLQLLVWLAAGGHIYEARTYGSGVKTLYNHDKICTNSVRLTRKVEFTPSQRKLFALDGFERVLDTIDTSNDWPTHDVVYQMGAVIRGLKRWIKEGCNEEYIPTLVSYLYSISAGHQFSEIDEHTRRTLRQIGTNIIDHIIYCREGNNLEQILTRPISIAYQYLLEADMCADDEQHVTWYADRLLDYLNGETDCDEVEDEVDYIPF